MSYLDSLNAALSGRGISASSFCNTSDATERRILMEYGAVFLASRSVSIPLKFMFDNEAKTSEFQASVKQSKEIVSGTAVELQEAAMKALLDAVAEAEKKNLMIKPRGGSEASRRSYAKTVDLWNKRIVSGISHWKAVANAKGKKLTDAEAKNLSSLSGLAQVKEVVRLEAEGFFFSTAQNKTIFASVAAPGTSQHLFMLALDIEPYNDPRTHKIMAENGWFQTAYLDDPHFTFLGLKESALQSLGLKSRSEGGHIFWTPQP